MNPNYSQQGQNLIQEAQKKLKVSFIGKFFSNSEDRFEEACDIYNQAATNFKLAQQYEQASNAYLQCVKCQLDGKLGNEQQYYQEAANMQLKDQNTAESAKYYNKAVECLLQKSQIPQAAKIKKQVAEIYEQELQYELAIQYYQEASDLYNACSDYTSVYLQILNKLADIKSQFCVDNFINQEQQILQQDQIVESIQIYEKVAKKYLENRLTAPSSRKLFQQAGLLFLLLDDNIGCENKMNQYLDMDPTSQNSREFKLVFELKNALEKNNKDLFQESINNYNQIIPLGKWHITILAAIKRIQEKQLDSGNLC